MNLLLLRKTINDFVGEGYGYIPAWVFKKYTDEEWISIKEALQSWQLQGFLTIERDPRICGDNEVCLKMHNFIDANEPIPSNWISYERKPPQWPTNSKS
jgi:hypothetical protein